jgi:hypothetical protein
MTDGRQANIENKFIKKESKLTYALDGFTIIILHATLCLLIHDLSLLEHHLLKNRLENVFAHQFALVLVRIVDYKVNQVVQLVWIQLRCYYSVAVSRQCMP